MRLDEDGMTYKGQRIEDGGEAHRAFLEVMSAMQPTPRTPTVSVGFIESIPNEVAELRARAERAEANETVALAQWNKELKRAMKAEAELAKYLSACPASPTEEERKRCQQWWAISGKSQ
jgi:hypothetical protein